LEPVPELRETTLGALKSCQKAETGCFGLKT
jgi:hypothetical protein